MPVNQQESLLVPADESTGSITHAATHMAVLTATETTNRGSR